MSNFSLLDTYSAMRRELRLIFANELKEYALGHQQALILIRLKTSPSVMSELSAYTQADPASTSRTVKGLEAAGLVKRVSDPTDARKSVIQLTAKGQIQAELAHKVRSKVAEAFAATLSTGEQKELMKLLGKVTSRLQERRGK